jgi:methyl-accepting chemotaxis protein
MKNQRLAVKIGVGFGILTAIAAALGLLALSSMSRAGKSSMVLSTEYMPQVSISNGVERNVMLARFNMRGYALADSAADLKLVKADLVEIKRSLQEAREAGGQSNSPNVVAFMAAVAKAEELMVVYESTVAETERVKKTISNFKDRSDSAFKRYSKDCIEYIASQNQSLEKELQAGADHSEILERIHKINVMNGIHSDGNDLRQASTVAQLNRDPALFKEALEKFSHTSKQIMALFAITAGKENQDWLNDILAVGKVYREAMDKLFEAMNAMDEIDKKRSAAASALLAFARDTATNGMAQTVAEAEATSASLTAASRLMLAGLLGAVAFASVVGLVTTRSITRPLARAVDFAKRVAGGDLDHDIRGYTAGSRDEVAILVSSMRDMVAALRRQMTDTEAKTREAEDQARKAEEALEHARVQEARVQEIMDGNRQVAGQVSAISERVSSASEQLSAQVEQVAAGTGLQQSRITETATAMDEMTASVVEVARNAGQAAHGVDQAKDRARWGAEVVGEAVDAIGTVSALAAELRDNMRQLGTQAQAIGQVIGVIDDIADQTNLLALNAAIEAARAGDAGRGFAVVADEVRKLAEKTMGATKEVGQSIKVIQGSVNANVASMDRAGAAVDRATELASQSGQALSEIVALVTDNAGQVQTIAAAAEEQSASSEQISRAIEQVSAVVTETSAGMVQSAQAVQELTRMAAELNELVRKLQ